MLILNLELLYYYMNKIIVFTFLILFFSCAEEIDINIDLIPFGSTESLDIITWNIENFPKSELTVDYVTNFITAFNDLDIIALQEIVDISEFEAIINSLDNWIGYRYLTEDTGYGQLAYLINANNIEILEPPSIIDYEDINAIIIDEAMQITEDQYEHYFAYRFPYLLNITYNEQQYHIINIHYKCCGNGNIEDEYWDEEYRRLQASYYLKQYIDNSFSSNVIVLGDFNDELSDASPNNIFQNFLDDSNYQFADIDISNESSINWSFPGWPSHLDHILMFNQNMNFEIQTLKLEDYMVGSWKRYDNYISDHRPVGLSILFTIVEDECGDGDCSINESIDTCPDDCN